MHAQTRAHLMTAMRNAAFTFARYRLCAVQARDHGRDQLADLVTETATEAYFDHFVKEAILARLIGTDAQNLPTSSVTSSVRPTSSATASPSRPTPSGTRGPQAASAGSASTSASAASGS